MEWPLPGPGSRAAVTLSPSLGADLLGCINRTREKERQEALYSHAAYVLVPTQKSRYRLAPYGSLSVDPAHGETPPPLGCDPEVVKTRADAICTGPRYNEVMKYEEEKRREERNRRKERPIDNFPPVLSSETLLTHFFRSRVSDLNSSLSPLPNSYSIRPAIQYRTRSSYLGVGLGRDQGGRASAHDLALMGASAACIVRSHR